MPDKSVLQTPEDRVTEIDVSEEMQGSFLEYAYSVIYTRALPDARDGLKPVQRRILYQMDQLGLRHDRGHVKSSRVVGEVMGKLHPHGDSAIYDALVRLAQPFNQRVPLVDGHGNFGSLDDGPAAPRYTEVRMDEAAELLTADLDEDTVNFVPNYDNQFLQPEVLPTSFPALLVNGASGIAVGMATTIAPHNPVEAISASLHLLEHPDATTENLMEYIPGPDFPGGGIIPDTAPIKTAYETGRGSFKIRAKVTQERITPRKVGLVVTELPYMVGPERVIERLKDAVNAGRVKGISAVTNLTDRHHGLRLVIDVKSGFNPQAVLAQLYKFTPLEETFSINAVALVEGQPRLLTLRDMLQVFVNHRTDVTKRRTEYRLARRQERLHLVEGLLIAILDIDEVIAIVRASDDAKIAASRLRTAFDLSDTQAEHILALRLRRLTRLSRLELEQESENLANEIKHLENILASALALRNEVAEDLRHAANLLSSARRTQLADTDPATAISPDPSAGDLEIADEPCLVVMTPTGELARVVGEDPLAPGGNRPRSLWSQWIPASTRGQVGLVDAEGLAHRVEVVTLPSAPRKGDGATFELALPAAELLGIKSEAKGLFPLENAPVVAIGTARGVVKRVRAEHPDSRDSWTVITLEDGDQVVSARPVEDDDDLVFVTKTARLLRTQAERVRPQGLAAGGMAGIKLAEGDEVLTFSPVSEPESSYVASVAQTGGTLSGTGYTTAKISPLEVFPHKGRATMGVRCQRFLRDEDSLGLAWVGGHVPHAENASGRPAPLPEIDERRDSSGAPLSKPLKQVG